MFVCFCFNLNAFFIQSLHVFEQGGALGKSTSLRSLGVSTYGMLKNFNIPRSVSQLLNLQQLSISAPEPQKVLTGGKVSYKTVPATDLNKELSGLLPFKLREITIKGQGFTSISDSILKVNCRFKIASS